jgi:hypothetical protein
VWQVVKKLIFLKFGSGSVSGLNKNAGSGLNQFGSTTLAKSLKHHFISRDFPFKIVFFYSSVKYSCNVQYNEGELCLDPSAYADYGPYMPGFVTVPYNDLTALEEKLKVPGHNEEKQSYTDIQFIM